MKKLVLAAAACIMGLSLFLGVQTASAAVVKADSTTTWTHNDFDAFTYQINYGAFESGEEFGIFSAGQSSATLSADNTLTLLTHSVPGTTFYLDEYLVSTGSGPSDNDLFWKAFTDYDSLELGTNAEWGFYFFSNSGGYLTDYTYERISDDYYTLTFGSIEIGITDVDFVPTPVPTAALLLGSGLVGLVGFRRRFGK